MVWWDAPSEDTQPFRFVLTYAQSSSEVVPAAGPDAVLGAAAFLPQKWRAKSRRHVWQMQIFLGPRPNRLTLVAEHPAVLA